MKNTKEGWISINLMFSNETAVFASDDSFRKIIISPALVHFDPVYKEAFVEASVFEKILKAQEEFGIDFNKELGMADYPAKTD